MAQIAKSLKAPEQGYSHREHRSRKGREKNRLYKKHLRKRLRRFKEIDRHDHEEHIPARIKARRKGKW